MNEIFFLEDLDAEIEDNIQMDLIEFDGVA
jgi:hypothetical protein